MQRINRLLQIEWLKLKDYRPFWIILIMYGVCFLITTCGGMLFLRFLKKQGADFEGLDPTILPLYDFPDLWQHMAYLGSFCKVILAFVVVISVANEENFRTLRQNIIDGLTKQEWWLSKMLLILGLSLGGTILLFLAGMMMGLIYSHPEGYRHIFDCLDMLAAFFLVLVTYLTFSFWITLLIPKVGLVIVGLFLYTIMFEPFLALFLENVPQVPAYIKSVVPCFPVRSLYYLIPVPFPKFLLMEYRDFVPTKEIFIVLGWLIINLYLSHLILRRKDW
ncbi:MAG: hypothetical protein HKN76_08730 [Saprospiraceae bacterium]|nr:hypothetical protein [Saprospiraceae bacterium]